VLLVLGDTRLQVVVSTHLRGAGAAVVEAQGVADALDVLGDALQGTRRSFDVVVTDGWLAGGTVVDLIAEIRMFDRHLPVIVILRRTTAALGVQEQAWELDAFAVFHEPFDLDALEAAVRCAQPGIVGHA